MIIISTSNAKLYMFAGLKKDTRQMWTGTLGFLRCQNATMPGMLYCGDNVTNIYSFVKEGEILLYHAQYSRNMYTYSSKAI